MSSVAFANPLMCQAWPEQSNPTPMPNNNNNYYNHNHHHNKCCTTYQQPRAPRSPERTKCPPSTPAHFAQPPPSSRACRRTQPAGTLQKCSLYHEIQDELSLNHIIRKMSSLSLEDSEAADPSSILKKPGQLSRSKGRARFAFDVKMNDGGRKKIHWRIPGAIPWEKPPLTDYSKPSAYWLLPSRCYRAQNQDPSKPQQSPRSSFPPA
ncbi:hypothetical protein F5Y16DRAFT_397598 [Xylariaceae sp. FL0255]|nr:hypothetical protein F5Y16DRAFT_397598 [Xylariaceae sp. FL0255]